MPPGVARLTRVPRVWRSQDVDVRGAAPLGVSFTKTALVWADGDARRLALHGCLRPGRRLIVAAVEAR